MDLYCGDPKDLVGQNLAMCGYSLAMPCIPRNPEGDAFDGFDEILTAIPVNFDPKYMTLQ